ncbi:uncharacterized protein LOC131846326 [Achroia grisella]|uniref:uncharacterized protein LOC131846326 n=1 Tax=Achroia grisella TaxID=688607 RepID=UPI0027D2F48E|nr:uncharacterized protein LOC131846326 [Achroia grisella]
MCSWTSKYAILRDLSEVQGHVPSEVAGTSGAEPPPTLQLTEETEEEYFSNCAGAGDCVIAPPDLSLIKEMLDMVKDDNSTSPISGEGDGENKARINTNCTKFIPKDTNETTNKIASPKTIIQDDKEKNVKSKKLRNAAVISLLDAKNETDTMKLLKPNDFLNSNVNESFSKANKDNAIESNISESLQKVDERQNSQSQNGSVLPNLTSSVSMFKKKNSVKNKSNDSQVVMKKAIENYTPSGCATQYYEKYVENAKLNESKHEDIWTRLEHMMREADAKKKTEMANHEVTCKEQETTAVDRLDVVRLRQHRHELTGECIVCKVMCTST